MALVHNLRREWAILRDGIQVALLGRETKSFNDRLILNEGLELFLHGGFPACMSYSFRVGFRFHFRRNERKKCTMFSLPGLTYGKERETLSEYTTDRRGTSWYSTSSWQAMGLASLSSLVFQLLLGLT
jgi:hypothetical protein